jgi:60 kDa SS-A/Ro ribonucleoprotein
MANKQLFGSAPRGKKPRPVPVDAKTGAPTRNLAGGIAYDLGSRGALAQYAATGTLNGTYYAKAEDQLKKTLELTAAVDSTFLAKVAVYSRRFAFMKDMPALLTAILFARAANGDESASRMFKTVFPIAIDNAKMLRNFVQMVRSGVTGRKSLGTMGKRVISDWFNTRNAEAIFRDSVGNDPSLADVIKLARPKSGTDPEKNATFNYLLGKEGAKSAENLPRLVKAFEDFKAAPKTAEVPKVPFEMLTALDLGTPQWTNIALNGRWHFIRMNLNTFARHGVLKDAKVVKHLADKLRDEKEIQGARVFPYQLLMAYKAVEHSAEIPMELKLALQDAMEIATKNVPTFEGDVWVCPDVSGSMSSSITGYRQGATSDVRCIDVAALIASSILRTSPQAQVLPFEQGVITRLSINPRDSVMTNATKLASIGGGGTNVAAALQHILTQKGKPSLIVIVSDNESWMGGSRYGATVSEAVWQQIKARSPNCKLVCIDIQPNATTQVADDRNSVLNIGGFSDQVFLRPGFRL